MSIAAKKHISTNTVVVSTPTKTIAAVSPVKPIHHMIICSQEVTTKAMKNLEICKHDLIEETNTPNKLIVSNTKQVTGVSPVKVVK